MSELNFAILMSAIWAATAMLLLGLGTTWLATGIALGCVGVSILWLWVTWKLNGR